MRLRTTILAAALGLLAVPALAAQEPVQLPTIDVVARDSADLQTIPGASAVVTRRQIERADPMSANELLRTVPGLHVQDEDNFGLNLNIGLRGLNPRRSSRVLLLEDGAPFHLGPYADPSMHYAPAIETIDRIEVLKGSGQVLHGPQTVGGVVNFVTTPPPDEFGGTLMLSAGTRDFLNGALSIGTRAGSVRLGLDYARREGEGSRALQRHSLDNLAARALIPLGAAQELLLKGTFFRERSNVGESGLTRDEFEADPFGNVFRDDRFYVDRYAGQAIHVARLAPRATLRTNAYFAYTDRASWRQSGESEERLGEDEYAEDFNCQPGATSYAQCGNQGRPRQYTFGGIEPRLELDWATGGVTSRLDIGARVHLEDVVRRQFVGNTPTSRLDDATLIRDNNLSTTAVAAYVRNQFAFGRLALTPGVRLERVSLTNENRFPGEEAVDEDDYTEVLPGLGASYQLGGRTSLFAGVHRGFAPPRPADIFSAEPGQPVVLVDPEVSWTWEVGVRTRPALGLSLDATFFTLDFSNEIIENPASEGQRFINGGETLHQGLELSATFSSALQTGSATDVYATASYTSLFTAKFNDGDRRPEVVGNRIPYAPKHLFSGIVGIEHRSGLGARLNVEHVSSQFGDEENAVEVSDDGQDGLLPAYTVLGASASYRLPRSPVTLRLSVKNLTNATYITDRSEGIQVGMPRTWMTEVVWAF